MNPRTAAFFSILCLLSTTAGAQPRPHERPTTPTEDCTTGGCHSQVTTFTVLHGPLTVGSCAACHRLDNPREHTFKAPRRGNDLCLFCHLSDEGSVIHQPMTEGNCLDCHDPHGGETRALLATRTTQELCARCHEDDAEKDHYKHAPFASGGCVACHAPHASNYPKLLVSPAPLLCLGCHVSLLERVERSRVVHEPARADCLACHDAHSAKEDMLLKKAPKALCLSCHEDIRSTMEHAKTQHGALLESRQCLNCHDPHGTDFPKILRNNPRVLCLDCHDKPIETPRGTIPDMARVLATGKSLHGPIAEDNCSACHQIHGGDLFRLLVEEYPSEFYAPFEEESYALCFSCHERSLVLEPCTTTLTGFRNGELNLHYLHVNQEKGRTCRACHEVHASNNPFQIRDTVPYGTIDWPLPLNFEMTPQGGSCTPGCHKPETYDNGGVRVPLRPGEVIPPPPPGQSRESQDIKRTRTEDKR